MNSTHSQTLCIKNMQHKEWCVMYFWPHIISHLPPVKYFQLVECYNFFDIGWDWPHPTFVVLISQRVTETTVTEIMPAHGNYSKSTVTQTTVSTACEWLWRAWLCPGVKTYQVHKSKVSNIFFLRKIDFEY